MRQKEETDWEAPSESAVTGATSRVRASGDRLASTHQILERLGFVEQEAVLDHAAVVFRKSFGRRPVGHQPQTARYGRSVIDH